MIVNHQEVIKLSRRATNGDTGAYEALVSYINSNYRRANTRLLSLEKAGFDMYAYDRAEHFLETVFERKRFPKATSKRDEWDIIQEAQQLSKFLNAKTSTIRGFREIEEKRLSNLREKYPEINGMTAEKQRSFLRFISGEETQNIFEETDRSSEIISVMISVWEDSERQKSKILRAFERYLAGRTNITQLQRGIKRSKSSKRR